MKKAQLSQLMSILLLFLILVGAVVVTLPLNKKVKEIRANKVVVAELLQQTQADFDDLNDLLSEVSTSEATKAALVKAVPVGLSQDELILELTELADDADFDLNAMNFSTAIDQVLGNTLIVAANFSGSVDDLIKFLQSIENADRLIQVTSLNVQLTSTEDVVFNLNLEAYYQ